MPQSITTLTYGIKLCHKAILIYISLLGQFKHILVFCNTLNWSRISHNVRHSHKILISMWFKVKMIICFFKVSPNFIMCVCTGSWSLCTYVHVSTQSMIVIGKNGKLHLHHWWIIPQYIGNNIMFLKKTALKCGQFLFLFEFLRTWS